jgi:antitoxin component YwqK of YwqJK toxin-antitoxin module
VFYCCLTALQTKVFKSKNMKKLRVILGFLFLTILVKAQVKQNENGLYANSDGSLYSGVLETEENGIKKSLITVEYGQLNGEVKYYYASGKLMEVGSYEKGSKHGKWIRYNESGMMTGIASYRLGKKDGMWLVWDDNGKKRFEMNYKNGEKTGVWYNWDADGNLLSQKDFSQVN